MEKTYKRVPFNIELAKKIQSGEVEGRICCDLGTIKMLAFDLSPIKNTIEGTIIGTFTVGERELLMFDNNGVNTNRSKKYNLYIELPEETQNLESVSKYLEELSQKKETTLERWYKSQEAPKREFKPFDKVLVRDRDEQWRCDYFSHISNLPIHKYAATSGDYEQCIPYDGNEHLVGTAKNPE